MTTAGELAFQEFSQHVRELWPSTRMTDEEIRVAAWNPRLRYAETSDIAQALRKHKQDEPDRTRPLWKAIFVLLKKQRRGANPYRGMLRSIRLAMHAAGNGKVADRLTDEELWQRYLDEIGRRHTRHPFTDAPLEEETCETCPRMRERLAAIGHPDAESFNLPAHGRRECAARREQESLTAWAVNMITEAGDEVPEYLVR